MSGCATSRTILGEGTGAAARPVLLARAPIAVAEGPQEGDQRPLILGRQLQVAQLLAVHRSGHLGLRPASLCKGLAFGGEGVRTARLDVTGVVEADDALETR